MSASSDMPAAPTRDAGLDILRGVLLTAMLGVHVAAAHATPAQGQALHAHFGIFIISSGFVALSGYAAALSRRPLSRRAMGALQLILVMVAWGVLLSLLRHALTHREEGCTASAWLPPTRFETLGILLAIAIVQVLVGITSAPPRIAAAVSLALACALTLLPGADTVVPREGAIRQVFDVLTQRTLTPFYTLTTFIALGVAGALLGSRSQGAQTERPPLLRALSAAAALTMSLPAVSGAALNPLYGKGGNAVGGLATLVYWSIVLWLLITAFRGANAKGPGRTLALLGRHSLLVFVVHLLLLELDAAAQVRLSLPRGLITVFAMFAVNLLVLVLLAWLADSRPKVAGGLRTLFLFGSQDRGWVARLSLALAVAAVVAAYSGPAFARPNRDLIIEDFEQPQKCRPSWSFGAVTLDRCVPPDPDSRSAALCVRGNKLATAGHGFGLYLNDELGARQTLELDVRGTGVRSGRVKIELSEDDNGNWDVEKDPRLFTPLYDDRVVFELSVDWNGWRHLRIPLSLFSDDNPGHGNDRFDPRRDLTSGGLLELQLLFSPLGAGSDWVELDIDNVVFTP